MSTHYLSGLIIVIAIGSSLCSQAAAQSILYVDDDAPPGGDGSSWSSAYDDLEVALATGAASGGVVQELRVAGGVYRPTRLASPPNQRSATFFLRPLRVIGGYAASPIDPNLRDPEQYPSILSGDIGQIGNLADNAYHVVTCSTGITNSSLLDGFVITGGNANGATDRGGGMYLEGDPVIRNCKIVDNVATTQAGGVYNRRDSTWTSCVFENNRVTVGNGSGGAFWNSGYPVLSGCKFIANHAIIGGGIYNTSPIITVIGCSFSSNTGASGVAINSAANSAQIKILDSKFDQNTGDGSGCITLSGSGPAHVVRCVFTANALGQYGGGIYTTISQLYLANCAFLGNSAGNSGGAIVSYLSRIDAVNCVFSGNSAPFGGAIADRGDPSIFYDCTFAGNRATNGRGGALHIEATPIHVNSIYWNNTDSAGAGESSQIWVESQSIFLNHCCVQGWTGMFGGPGNQGSDPLFVSQEGADGIAGTIDDNLRLQSGSPSIDAGINIGIAPDFSDLDSDGNTSEPAPFDYDLQARLVGPVVDLGAFEWTVFLPTGYCVSKLNSLGCSPSIGYSGLPTLTGADDFVVSATSVMNQKKGVLLWGTTPDSTPFGGGTLCIQTPIVRNPGVSSLGNPLPPDCSGIFACLFDQVYMARQNLTAGTQVYAQFWSRDPGFSPPYNIGLTNALRFTILP